MRTKRGGLFNRNKTDKENERDWYNNWKEDPSQLYGKYYPENYYPGWKSKGLGAVPLYPDGTPIKETLVPHKPQKSTESKKTLYSILVSHNSRIQCLLAKLGYEPPEQLRFQNGCVLKITVSPSSIQVSLLHTGNITDSDNKSSKRFYYVPGEKPEKDDYVEFTPLDIDMDRPRFGLSTVELDTTYVFYVVRHGQSQHNQKMWSHMVLDTHLIEEGKMGAAKAGEAIRSDIDKQPNAKLCAYFVSDLVRTRETLQEMKSLLVEKSIPTVVLPCASEVAQVGKDGDCDAIGNLWNKKAQENYPKCTAERIFANDKNDKRCSNMDWTFYLTFYGQNMRGAYGSDRMRCRDTNMLAMAIYWLSFRPNGTAFFGKTETLEEFMNPKYEILQKPRMDIPPPTGPPSYCR